MKSNWLTILLVLIGSVGFAQNELSLDEAIKKVFSNNFDVSMSELDLAVARNNVSPGNAGLLPSVGLNGGGNYSNNYTKLKFAGGIPSSEGGAQNTGYNASIGLNYTVFNGFASLRTFDKLKEAENLSEAQLRLTLENAIITVIGLYYDQARLQTDLAALNENLELSRTRLERVKTSRDLGAANSLDVLNAQLDLHNDSMAILNVENQLGAVTRQMNQIMGESITNEFLVPTNVGAFQAMSLDSILMLAKNNNTALVMAGIQEKMADLDIDLARANSMPTISLTSAYGYNASQNGRGIVLEQSSLGFSSGISISIPIFNGGKVKTAMENAGYAMDKSKVQRSKNELSVEREVYDYWNNYQYYKQLQEVETKNLSVAELSLKRSEDSYRLGQITSLELRQAQLQVLNSKNRISAAMFNMKKMEYQLLRMAGALVNE